MNETQIAILVEDVAKIISGAPFPSKQKYTKARQVVEFMTNRAALTDQDAARYRCIRDIAAGDPYEFGEVDNAAFTAIHGNPEQFDMNIDLLLAERLGVTP